MTKELETAAPKRPIKSPKATAKENEQDVFISKLSAGLAKATGIKVTYADVLAWYEGEGEGNITKVDKAIAKLIPNRKVRDAADSMARLDSLVAYVLKMGPDKVGGISMKALLAGGEEKPAKKPAAKAEKTAPAKKPAASDKRAAANAAKVKAIKAGIAKLKQQKGVQSYIKLAKALQRLQG